jgi:hypothetical protein
MAANARSFAAMSSRGYGLPTNIAAHQREAKYPLLTGAQSDRPADPHAVPARHADLDHEQWSPCDLSIASRAEAMDAVRDPVAGARRYRLRPARLVSTDEPAEVKFQTTSARRRQGIKSQPRHDANATPAAMTGAARAAT